MSSSGTPVDASASSNSACARDRASSSAICTRLWASSSPSGEVSIGRKSVSLKCAITSDCTPSDCMDGMQPNGFRLSTMWARFRCV